MSDIEISPFHWEKLKKYKNSFMPALLGALNPLANAPTNRDISNAARDAGTPNLAEHRISDVLRLLPLKAGTVDNVLRGYLKLKEARIELKSLSEADIIIAALAVPKLEKLMEQADVDVSALVELSGVSEPAVNYVQSGGRATGGIVCALHAALATKIAIDEMPPLNKFASANIVHGSKSIAITDGASPFSYEDLLLPLADGIPKPWP